MRTLVVRGLAWYQSVQRDAELHNRQKANEQAAARRWNCPRCGTERKGSSAVPCPRCGDHY